MKKESDNIIKEIKKYALVNKVPIMLDEGIDFLTTFIQNNAIKNILEIGSAIGYSAIMMALTNTKIKITSIERDEERYLEAVKNIKKMGLENQITLIFKDALDVKLDNQRFDLIFIDAAKGKNKEFFELFEQNLAPKGYFITDNIKFHGFLELAESEITSKNMRGLVRKIKDYIEFLKTNPNYKTDFYDAGDGVAVSSKIE